jgi:hypothetical protein
LDSIGTILTTWKRPTEIEPEIDRPTEIARAPHPARASRRDIPRNGDGAALAN